MHSSPSSLYLIGSLRNPEIPRIAEELRIAGFSVFDDWYSPGPETDEKWQGYEDARGRTYLEALQGHHAKHVFDFDVFHLHRCHGVVLAQPAGKSAHLEFGHVRGQGRPGWIFTNGPVERYDIMTQFATALCPTLEDLIASVTSFPWPKYQYAVDLNLSDAMWLAGLLEGEGSFGCDAFRKQNRRPRPRLALGMTDEDIMRRAAGLLDSRLYGPYNKGIGKKLVWCVNMTGLKAAEYMRVLRPYMGSRRGARIEEVLRGWDAYQYQKRRKRA